MTRVEDSAEGQERLEVGVPDEQATPSFRELLQASRSESETVLPRLSDVILSQEATEFCSLLRGGNPHTLQLISTVLGEGPESSALGGDLASLAGRLRTFYRNLGKDMTPDLAALQAEVRALREGTGNPAYLLELLVTILPGPANIVWPETLAEASQMVEGVTTVLELRRRVRWLVARAVAAQAPAVSLRVDRLFERQTVLFLAQLEIACTVADRLLCREMRSSAMYDARDVAAVSQQILKGYAVWARRAGYPVGVREQRWGEVAREVRRRVRSGVRNLLADLGGSSRAALAIGVRTGQRLGGMIGRAVLWAAAFSRAHPQIAWRVVLTCLLLLAFSASLLMLPVGLNHRSALGAPRPSVVATVPALAPAATATGRSQSVPGSTPTALAPGTALMIQVTATGDFTLGDLLRYFGLNHAAGTGFLLRLNGAGFAQAGLGGPGRNLYSENLPAGMTLSVPATVVTARASLSLAELAQQFGTTEEAIARLNPTIRLDPDSRAYAPNTGVLVVPVGLPAAWPKGPRLSTAPAKLDPAAPNFRMGSVLSK